MKPIYKYTVYKPNHEIEEYETKGIDELPKQQEGAYLSILLNDGYTHWCVLSRFWHNSTEPITTDLCWQSTEYNNLPKWVKLNHLLTKE